MAYLDDVETILIGVRQSVGLVLLKDLWHGVSARWHACSDRAIIAESLVAGNFAIMSLQLERFDSGLQENRDWNENHYWNESVR